MTPDLTRWVGGGDDVPPEPEPAAEPEPTDSASDEADACEDCERSKRTAWVRDPYDARLCAGCYLAREGL